MKYKQYAIAIALLLTDTTQAGPNAIKVTNQKSIKNLVQQSAVSKNSVNAEGKEGRLSDQLKDLSSKLPETRVLEHKLEKMVTLEPAIANALQGINKITEAPNQDDLRMQGAETKHMVEEIEHYTDGRQGITKFTDKMRGEKDEAINQINNYANELNGSDKSTLFDDMDSKPAKKVIASKVAAASEVAQPAVEPAAEPATAESKEEKKEAKEEKKEAKKEKKEAIKELKKEMKEDAADNIKDKVKAVTKKAVEEEKEDCDETEGKSLATKKKSKKEEAKEEEAEEKEEKKEAKKEKKKAKKEAKKEEDGDDDEKPTHKIGGSTDLVSKMADMEKEEKVASTSGAKTDSEKQEITDAVTQAIETVNESQNGKQKKASDEEMQKEVEEEAESLVEKARLKAEQKIKKSVAKKESMADGIISLVSDNLSRKAKIESDQDDMRAKIEAVVQTRAVSTEAKISATRDSLQAGFDATREPLPTSMKDIEGQLNASIRGQIQSLVQQKLQKK